jgi:hypothetical protein
VKVLVMENRDRKTDDEPSHHLFFVEAPDRYQGGRQAAQERFGGPGAPPTGQKLSNERRRSFQAQAPLDRDDVPEWAR